MHTTHNSQSSNSSSRHVANACINLLAKHVIQSDKTSAPMGRARRSSRLSIQICHGSRCNACRSASI